VGVQLSGREADHSPPSSAEVNAWGYTSTTPIRLHGVVLMQYELTLQTKGHTLSGIIKPVRYLWEK